MFGELQPGAHEHRPHALGIDGLVLGGSQASGQTHAIAGPRLDRVAAARVQDELGGHAPARPLALGDEPAEVPLDAVRQPAAEAEGALAGHAHVRGEEGAHGGGHELDRAAQVGEPGPRGMERQGVRHPDGACGERVLGAVLQDRAALVPQQPPPLPERRRALVLGRRGHHCTHGARGVCGRGGLPDRGEAERERRVAVGQHRELPGGKGDVSDVEGAQRVGAGGQPRQHELASAVGEGDEPSVAHPLAEDRDQRAGHRSPVGALHPTHEPASPFPGGGAAREEGRDQHRSPPMMVAVQRVGLQRGKRSDAGIDATKRPGISQ